MAANNYAACLKEILKHEGGYVDHPSDPGGETNYGITVAVARANGYQGDMRSIPMDLVRTIYRKKYWDAVDGDNLPAGVDLCVFDYAVNSGPGRAKPLLAKIGTGWTPQHIINQYCDARMAFLRGLRTWPTFGRGWTRRVDNVRATALRMAAAPLPSPPVAVPPPKAPEQPAEKNAPTGKLEPKAQDVATVGVFVAIGTAIYTTWEWLVAHPVIAVSAAVALIGAIIFAVRWWRAHRIRKAGLAAVDEEFAKPEPVTEAPTTDADALAAAIANKARGAVACQEAVTTAMAKPVRRKARKKPKKPAKRLANKKRKAS